MLDKIKIPAIVGGSVIVFLWAGFSTFRYFTYSSAPEVKIGGLTKNGYYSGALDCSVQSQNGYKISDVAVSLDGKEFKAFTKVGSKNLNLPLKIDTLALTNGQHVLTLNSVDSSYHKNKSEEKLEFYVDNTPLTAAFLNQEYKVEQGRTIHARLQTNKKIAGAQIKFLEKIYDCYPESDYSTTYECFIPIDCEQVDGEYVMEAQLQDCVKNDMKVFSKVYINAANFPKQKGFSVAKGKLEEEKEVSMNNKILEEAISKWLQDSPKKKLWTGTFEVPIDVKKVATPFGEVRTSSEKGRYIHKAVDVLNFPKSVVWAAQTGKVIIKDRFLMSGNTVVLDHGLGVFTLYYHLEDFADIEIGDTLKKGNPLGRVGMTGYANGYHLHWELRVNNVPVDPFEWTKKTF
jgi:hypothetical protein